MTISIGSANFQGTPEEIHSIHNLLSGLTPMHRDNVCAGCDRCECDRCNVLYDTRDDEEDEALVA